MCSIFVISNIGLTKSMNWVILYRTESQLGIWKTIQQIFFCHKQQKVTKIKLQPLLLLHRIVTLWQNLGQYSLKRWWWKSFPPTTGSCNTSLILSMPRSTSSSIKICLHIYNKQSTLSEHPVICVMKGWVLLNSTALEHGCLHGNNFPGMVTWCFPTTTHL